MPLIYAPQNETRTIVRITGKDAVRTHLRDLGIVENESITLLQSFGGNVIVEVKGVRFGLDENMARRIQV